jgi:hypothetical protein
LNLNALYSPLDPSIEHHISPPLSSTQCYRPASQQALFPLEFWIAHIRTSLLGGIFSAFPFRSFVTKSGFPCVISTVANCAEQNLEIDMVLKDRIGRRKAWHWGQWLGRGTGWAGFWSDHIVRFGEPFICSSLRHVWHNSEI